MIDDSFDALERAAAIVSQYLTELCLRLVRYWWFVSLPVDQRGVRSSSSMCRPLCFDPLRKA